MASRVRDRLEAARRRWFVGREAERQVLRDAITATDLPFCVLYLYGPGGVGKTTLLGEFARVCEDVGIAAYHLDARNMEPMPESFSGALRQALALATAEDPLDALAARPGRHVILIDTYETLAPLDGWLRDRFLPSLPENTLIVLAGRYPPAAGWRVDPGWQTLLHVMPLRNLSPGESRAFLSHQEIPTGQHRAVLEFTHGHPLALSLVADLLAQRDDIQFQPEAAPDVVKALLERFMQQVPEHSHRLALEACANVRVMTEALLAEVLETPVVHDLFEWLRGLSFIESDRFGIFPHDLAREALIADLRWRNPERYAELHDRARDYYIARLRSAREGEQQAVLRDYIFLHRDNPVVRPFFEWEESGSVLTDTLRAADLPLLVEMVAAHEGEDSGRVAAHWLERQPEGVLVFRDAEQQPAGFMCSVALHDAGPEDLSLDPAALAAARFLQAQAPLRRGEIATLFRFWMARDTYQAVSSTQSLTFVNAVRHYLTTPGLAVTFFTCAEPEFWAPVFAYAGLARVPEADFEVGGRHYGMYWHDWRVTPPMAWLQLLAEREIASATPAAPPTPTAPLLVLSQAAFAAAIKDALRDFHRPDALRRNPLLRSRLVAGRAGAGGDGDRSAALRSLIEERVAAFQQAPRDAKLARALDRTYLHPAATQEQAAELLDLPFSTYRRHLAAGVARLIDSLWQSELHGGAD